MLRIPHRLRGLAECDLRPRLSDRATGPAARRVARGSPRHPSPVPLLRLHCRR